jgi:ATP-dependent RNA helicase DDX54/DBP10
MIIFRYEKWQKKTKVSIPRAGETESKAGVNLSLSHHRGKNYKHTKDIAPKPLDPKSTNYEKQLKKYQQKLKHGEISAMPTQKGRYAKSELKDATKIRKDRERLEQRRAKNARPSKKQKYQKPQKKRR